MNPKTFSVLHREGAWKIVEEDRVVGSYATRVIACRRALQKAEAASARAEEQVLVLFYNRENQLDESRAVPTSRKPRTNS